MSLFYAFAVYFIIWWITLFLVLPYGVKSQAESEENMVLGTEPGAPINARIGFKLVVNTLLATIVFAVWYIATDQFGFSMDALGNLLIGYE